MRRKGGGGVTLYTSIHIMDKHKLVNLRCEGLKKCFSRCQFVLNIFSKDC